MRKIFTTIICMLLIGFTSKVNAQFSTSNTAPYNSAFYLINDVFAGGNVAISNVTSYGNASQMGFFSGNTTIGMDSGIVLSTGTINELCSGACPLASTIPGNPGNANGLTYGFPWMGTTATNNNLYNTSASVPGLLGFGAAPNDVNDAAVISFDFVPTLDTMHFSFVFASKEWPTYPCSSFNDIFGFYVSGPGITGTYNAPPGYTGGAENYAKIPSTNIPITITSISGPNHKGSCANASYPQYFVPNVAANSGMSAHYTTVMDVEFVVQPCQTYNFTMGIADGSDGALSSFVMMEANSFMSTGVTVNFNATYDLGGDSILYEGCGSVEMEIVRADNIQNADTIHFNISGNATNGVDYTLLPDSVIFAPGQTSFSHNFWVPNDYLVEGPETIMVFVTDTDLVTCTGTGDTLEIVIQDPIPLLSDALPDTINCTQDGTLDANMISGLSDFDYIWSTGDTDSLVTISPAPLVSTDYYVTITDACSIYTVIDTVHLVIDNPVLSISAGSDTITCDETGTAVSVDVFNTTGYPNSSIGINWSSGHTTKQFWGFSVAKPKVSQNLIVTVTQGCSGQLLTDSFQIVIDNPPFTLNIPDDTINCTDGGTTLMAQVTNFTPSFVYLWDHGKMGPAITENPSVNTTYTLTVTDGCGVNSKIDSATIYVINDPISVYAPSASIQCVGDQATLEAFANGGYRPYTYAWSGGGTDSTIVVTSNGSNAVYTVSVTDICGMDTVVQNVNVNIVVYPDLAIDSMPGDTFLCTNNPISLSSNDVRVTGGSGDYYISWDNWASMTNYMYDVVDSTTTYTVQAFDSCNYDTASQTVTYVVLSHGALQVDLPADTHLCQQEQLDILASTSGGAGGYSYLWSNGVTGEQLKVRSNTDQTYSVTVTDACGEVASGTMDVVISQPTADFDYFFFNSNDVGFKNLSEDADFYLWNFGDGDTSTSTEPLKHYEESQIYNVRLTAVDSFGCRDSIYKKITPPLVAFVPNSFTPNGDELNDVFEIYGEGFKQGYDIKEFRIDIYDRWGVLVFSSRSADFQWDGTSNGKKVAVGSYVYQITVEGYEQQKMEISGTINVLE